MFYGWIIVALAFVSLFVTVGTLAQCSPAFMIPFTEEFGIGRAQAALNTVMMSVGGVAITPLVGRAVGTFPIRNVMLAGAAALALGFLAMSLATAWWMVLAVFGVVGSFAVSAISISCNTLVVNWFERRRAIALGIALFGMSISGAVLTPLATWSIQSWGWRATYQGFGGLGLALIPLLALLVVDRPSDRGVAPDGDEAPARRPEAGPDPADAPLSSTRELLSSGSLWLIAAACGLIFFGSTGLVNHGVAFATDRGIDPMRAAGVVSGFFVGGASGKLFFGWLADRLGERGALAVAQACCATALLSLLAVSGFGPLSAATVLYGFGMGGVAPLQSALLARCFGTRDFAPAMGLIAPLMLPFHAGGPPLAGVVSDRSGSYDPALWIFLAALAVSALALSRIRLAERPLQRPDPRDRIDVGDGGRGTRPGRL